MPTPPFPGGPTPAYNNPPIEPQYFKPSRFEIADISLGPTTTVTTIEDQNYVIGQQVRLLIPQQYGTVQLNNQVAYVTSIPSSTQVVLDIVSTGYNSFIASPASQTQNVSVPQIIAIGDINSGNINNDGNRHTSILIPGSFHNISPR